MNEKVVTFKTIRKFSHSVLNSAGCPYKYVCEKVTKNHRLPFTDTPERAYGRRLHSAIEMAVRLRRDSLFGFEEYNWVLERVNDVEKQLQSRGGKVQRLPELPLAMDWNGGPVGYSSKQALFIGRVDLVLLTEKVAVIIDFKTGKTGWPSYEQLTTSALLVMSHYPSVDVVRAGFVYTVDKDYRAGITMYRDPYDPRRDETDKVYSREMDLLRHTMEEVDGLVSLPSHEIPRIPSGLCRDYCAVPSDECPHSPRGEE